MNSPADTLITPQANDVIPPTLDTVLRFPEFLSPMGLGGKFAKEIGLPNQEDFYRSISGDWNRVSLAADAAEKLSAYCRELGRQFEEKTSELSLSWSGQAADQSQQYFADLSRALHENSLALSSISDQLDQSTMGVYGQVKVMGSLLDKILDIGIVFLAKLAASALAATNPGTAAIAFVAEPVGDAALLFKAISLVKAIADAHAKALLIMDMATGALVAPSAALKRIPELSLPGSYDNKQVPQ